MPDSAPELRYHWGVTLQVISPQQGTAQATVTEPVDHLTQRLIAGEQIGIGRSASCHVQFPDTYERISGHHGTLALRPDGILAYTDSSKNGTRVLRNGVAEDVHDSPLELATLTAPERPSSMVFALPNAKNVELHLGFYQLLQQPPNGS